MPIAFDRSVGTVDSALAWLDRRAAFVFAVFSGIAFIGLLYLGRKGSFHYDEWVFIRVGDLGTLQDWFAPNNEHWSTVPFGIYRALLLTVGLRSYLPYLAVLLVIHVVTSAGLFVLLRRASGGILALIGSTLFLVLGSANAELFWAFQIGFVASAAAGLWGLVALDRSMPRLAGLLFLISVASSAMGLPMLVAGFVDLAQQPGRRRELTWLVAVAAVFLVWFLAIGHTGLASQTVSGGAVANLFRLPTFALSGLVGAFRATFGLSMVLGAIGLVAVLAAGVGLLARRELPSRAVSAAAGLASMYVLIGIGRAQSGDAEAYGSRYLYETVAFLLIALSAIIGHRADLAPGVTQRGSYAAASEQAIERRRGRVALGLLVIALVVSGAVSNVQGLLAGARTFEGEAGVLRAALALIDQYGDRLPYDPPSQGSWFPTLADLTQLPRRWGTPAADVLFPSVVRPPTPVARDQALWHLVGNATKPRPIDAPSGAPSAEVVAGPPSALPRVLGQPPRIAAVAGAVLVPTGDCMAIQAARSGPSSRMTVAVEMEDATSVDVMTVGGGTGAIRLGRDRPPVPADQAMIDYPDRSWMAVAVPHLGDGSVFTLQLLFPPNVTAAVVCNDRGALPKAE